jgi:hypothetical protein
MVKLSEDSSKDKKKKEDDPPSVPYREPVNSDGVRKLESQPSEATKPMWNEGEGCNPKSNKNDQ